MQHMQILHEESNNPVDMNPRKAPPSILVLSGAAF